MSDDPITRPSSLTEEHIEKIVKALKARGGQITYSDPRISRVRDALLGLIGVAALGVLGWMASSVDKLNRNMERQTAQWEYTDRRVTRLEDKYAQQVQSKSRFD